MGRVRRPDRVLLAQMPMGLVQVPSLALSLLKPALVRAGIPCDVRYLNVEFLTTFLGGYGSIGPYVRMVENQQLSEICAAHFSMSRFGHNPARDEIVTSILETADAEQRALIDKVVQSVSAFLDYCLEAVDWSQYALVGFTSLFPGMTMPSVVLGGRLKERFPHLRVVLGGWNTGGLMGEVLAEKFVDELDFVLRGEADETLPALAAAVIAGAEVDASLPGLIPVGRRAGLRCVPQQLVPKMDALPFPDFDDYFVAVPPDADGKHHARSLSFESSRGCWWGQVSHCKFCGLNGLSMPFRSKSPQRMLAELDHIVDRYHPDLLFATDTIIDSKYFTELLPTMAGRYPKVRFAYEVKAPVTREQMRAIANARITHITVGVESLSTRILRVMGKGTTALQNIHCLKVAAEAGVHVGWQHLIGFPTETLDDYMLALKLMSRLHHLEAPQQACPVMVARFSPYYEQAESLKVGNLRPAPEYLASYPWPVTDVGRVAYHFRFDHADGRDPGLTDQIAAVMRAAVADWQERRSTARLDVYRGASLLAIVDTRRQRSIVYLLSGLAKDVYEALDSPTAESALLSRLTERGASEGDWLVRLLAVDSDADQELLAWTVETAREIDATIVRIGGDDVVAGSDSESLQRAIRTTIGQLDRAELIASEGDRHLALAVRSPRTSVPASTAVSEADREKLAVARG